MKPTNSSPALSGLIAATYTPMHPNGDLNLEVVPSLVDHLMRSGISGLYVCGSTGEGMSLTTGERQQLAGAFVDAANDRVPVIVQVGHNSLRDARELAAHAESIGAHAISATCPSYYKIADSDSLVDCMCEVATAAPETPFYYYHIPALTGSSVVMPEFLRLATERMPTLRGLKYTDTKLHEFMACKNATSDDLDVVWGCDEMLLGALATGANAAIGSTYNIAANIYQRVIKSFAASDFDHARKWQLRAVEVIRVMGQFPFHPATKAVLEMQGVLVGPCRLPLGRLSETQLKSLHTKLTEIGFFDWNRGEDTTGASR
ncbi:dihydrodipicolinate synthase family protein [Rhodopirellula halodulae]|uniref:dihydrodipicolinate synthase family protein n=1 Tax=Rhodopirellula halodulae TaxID=2894198 RepID=UPI001E2D526B|nr:dihydrodipicolinate synthase family protein [Rhodopirellula sp. JC737]MCC9658639.1 dihydrodipicolinate synthase family protein [Rhodopirellula sp. JC737]